MSRRTREEMSKKRRDEQLVALVNDDKKYSESEFSEYYRRCKRWYDLYRGLYTQQYQGFRNSISIPFLYSVIQSDVARKAQMSFGQFPFVSFESFAPEDEAIARKNELLIGVQMEDAHMYSKAVDFFTTADLYGVGISRDGWRQVRRLEKMRVPNLIAPGVVDDITTEQWVSFFDGPDVEVLDPLDCFPQPGFRYIHDMGYFIYQYWREWDDLMDMVEAELEAGEEPSYDLEALKEIERRGMSASADNTLRDRMAYARSSADFNQRQRKYNKPVHVVERWGMVPRDLVGPDGERMRRIVVMNQQVLARDSGNPYFHGQLPFAAHSVGDPHFFHGVGKSELLAKLQGASNRMLNHKLDSLDMAASPAWIVGANSGLDSNRPLQLQPGKILQLDTNTVGDDVIRPLQPDMTGLDHVTAELENLWRYMQQGSGIIEDTVSGAPASREQTAYEFRGRQEGVMSRLLLESRQAEENWIEPIANRFRALNRQFLPVPKQVRRIGSAAIKDLYGQPIEEADISHEDLWPDYKARAFGANQNMLRNETRDGIIQVLQASSSNQALLQAVNWGNFAREMFTIFGFRNVNALLTEIPFVAEAADQMQQAQAGGTTAAANAPENLPVGLLSNPGNDQLGLGG